MSLSDVIKKAIDRISEKPGIKDKFQSFEGDKVALKLKGDKTLIFTVTDGVPVLVESEAEVQSARAVAEIDAKEFAKFIDGREHFGALFKIDFEKQFKTEKGEFYDFGGDFMLLGPLCDELTRVYMEDSEIRNMMEKYKKL
jgi:hypothetical protein